MSEARRTVVVLGSFLESEYFNLWQRQQEFTTHICRIANVLYVERAAAGPITPRRLVGRLQKLVRRPAQGTWRPALPIPVFVKWQQLPFSGEWASAESARRVWRAVEARVAHLGWQPPSFVCVGSPGEVWAALLRAVGLPFWYDMSTRLLLNPTYSRVSRDAMTWMATEAALVTADTEVSRDDWSDVRADICVVPHGAKEWADEPNFDLSRGALYYVGSINSAIDAGILNRVAREGVLPVRVIGTDADHLLRDGEVLGWRSADSIPRLLSEAVAGLIPYRVDRYTEGVYPTKVFDYLLAGAPVVSSELPALKGVPGVVMCGSVEDYLRAAEEATRMSRRERADLREWALSQGWSTRFAVVTRELAARGISIGVQA